MVKFGRIPGIGKLDSTEVEALEIRADDLTGAAITGLLRQHHENMRAITPGDSCHVMDIDALRAPDITFWSVWEGGALLGCGALKELDAASGEVKSMRTSEAHRGKGVASMVLNRIVEEAKSRNYEILNLETGSMDDFAPSRSLYRRFGFELRGPFADYIDNPNTVFMAMAL